MGAKKIGTIMPTWLVCTIAAALISLMSCAAIADTAITKVDVANQADRVVINVQASGPLHMSVIKSSVGRFLAFQFSCKMAAKGRLVGIRSGRVYNVRYSNFQPYPPASRVVLNTICQADYSTEWSADKKQVDITVLKFSRAQAAKPTEANPGQQAEVTAPVTRDFIPVEVKEPAKPAAVTIKPEEKKIAAEPAALAVPDAVTPAPSIPAISRTNLSSPAHSAPVPAEPEQAAIEPIAKIAPSAALTTKTISVDNKPVETAVAPAVEHIAKGSESGEVVEIKHAPAAKMERVVSAAPNIPISPRISSGRRVSLNFLGADIHDVLKALSTQSGMNIVAGKDVSGNVTVSLANVGVEEALDYVAKLSGYNYAKENETYLVGSKDSLNAIKEGTPVGPKVLVCAVKYTNVKSLIDLLKNQFPDMKFTNGNSSDDKDTKTIGGVIVVSGSIDTVDSVKSMVDQVDESMRSISQDGDSDIYYVKHVSIVELIGTLESLFPGVRIVPLPSDGFELGGAAGVAGGSANSGSNSSSSSTPAASTSSTPADSSSGTQTHTYSTRSPGLVIYGNKQVIEKVMETAQKLDVKSPMIKIEAKVTSLNETGEKKLGLSWAWGDITMLEMSPKHWERQPFDFSATLDALIKDGNGKLLAAPSLMCLEGKPGSFFVGDKVRYILYVENTQNGKNIKTEEANVGIELLVNGDVSPDGYITMNLHPEVSTLQLTKDQQTGVTLPIISRRYTDHIVRVKNGETIVIGGLISDKDLVNMQKVPLLGDIPFLGNLFRHKEATREHTEVVVFITASIIKD